MTDGETEPHEAMAGNVDPKEEINSPNSTEPTGGVDDEGEIHSDGEGGEADSTTPTLSAADRETNAVGEEPIHAAAAAAAKRPHQELIDLADDAAHADDEPKTKKSALEHLRNMKFSKRDPFSDSANRDQRSFRFNRDSRSPRERAAAAMTSGQAAGGTDSPTLDSSAANSDGRRKRYHADDDRRGGAGGGRYRRSSPYSSQRVVSSSADAAAAAADLQQHQTRQRSTMYFLMQGNNSSNSGQTNNGGDHHHSAPASSTSSFYQHQLPAGLKSTLVTVGHLKQKMESLLALSDDQVFSLPAPDLRALLLYAVEMSLEQDRLLAGRKAQLKQLDEMITKERGLIEKIFHELPTQLRPNMSDVFGGGVGGEKSLNSSSLYGLSVNSTTDGAGGGGGGALTAVATSSAPGAAVVQPLPGASVTLAPSSASATNVPRLQTGPAPPPAVNFTVPPPPFSELTTSQPSNQFSQPPPPVVIANSSAPLAVALADFSLPPPSVASTAVPPPPLQLPPSTIVASSAVSNLAAAPMAFTTPPPIVPSAFTSSASVISSTTPVSIQAPVPVNTSIPPPNISSIAPSANVGQANTSMKVSNLSAPPPPIDFSLPPPTAAKPTDSAAPLMKTNEGGTSTLTSSHSSSSLSSMAGGVNIAALTHLPPPAVSESGGGVIFNVPPPLIQKNIASSNIAAALDLSVPPPSLTQNTAKMGDALLHGLQSQHVNMTTPLPNLSQPPPQMPPKAASAVSTTTKQQVSASILASVAASIQQQQHQQPPPLTNIIGGGRGGTSTLAAMSLAVPLSHFQQGSPQQKQPLAMVKPQSIPLQAGGPRPLMSVEHPPPLGFLAGRAVAGGSASPNIRSLASISQRSVVIQKKPLQLANKRDLSKKIQSVKTNAADVEAATGVKSNEPTTSAVLETAMESDIPQKTSNEDGDTTMASAESEVVAETTVENTPTMDNVEENTTVESTTMTTYIVATTETTTTENCAGDSGVSNMDAAEKMELQPEIVDGTHNPDFATKTDGSHPSPPIANQASPPIADQQEHNTAAAVSLETLVEGDSDPTAPAASSTVAE